MFSFHSGSELNSVDGAFFKCHAVPNAVRPFYRGHDHSGFYRIEGFASAVKSRKSCHARGHEKGNIFYTLSVQSDLLSGSLNKQQIKNALDFIRNSSINVVYIRFIAFFAVILRRINLIRYILSFGRKE